MWWLHILLRESFADVAMAGLAALFLERQLCCSPCDVNVCGRSAVTLQAAQASMLLALPTQT
jgi:hypothetical protein